MPAWAPDRMPIPFIWLYRGSSGMPFSCIDSMGLCIWCMLSWGYPPGPWVGMACPAEGGPGLGPIIL